MYVVYINLLYFFVNFFCSLTIKIFFPPKKKLADVQAHVCYKHDIKLRMLLKLYLCDHIYIDLILN